MPDVPEALASGVSLVELLLAQQQMPTAIERFAERSSQSPSKAARYRDLLPLSQPEPDEQYAFTVDLDACSGCKACVTACHQLNGLQDDEAWRDVGMLVDKQLTDQAIRYVTTACHHCVDPGCLRGCPTRAYEKDPVTGIVRHLDDQCFGCQYCTMMCPYDVPKYRPSLGIVRKCDLCRQRLAVEEAPACVQACPNRAIRVSVVSQEEARAWAAAGKFLPDAPDPQMTVPTTRFLSRDSLALQRFRAVDHARVRVAPMPASLISMLVATQASVGLFAVSWLIQSRSPQWHASARVASVTLATVFGVVGIHLALLHLGRPALAMKAWLGWRTSWLSREAIAFGLWMPLAIAVACDALEIFALRTWQHNLLLGLTSCVGAVGVGCSAMIYAATGRIWWSVARTASRFLLTAILLGSALSVAIRSCLGDNSFRTPLMTLTCVTLSLKALVELEPLLRRDTSPRFQPIRDTGRLLRGPLRTIWRARWFAAFSALIVAIAAPTPFNYALAAVLLLIGEVLERALFFGAVVSSRMPGNL